MTARRIARRTADVMPEDDPLWYKDAIIYELHVRAFFDSDGDGVGDFRGLTEKLDYLQDFGVTVLWLLPFYPSPLKDDGYDIADYTGIHPAYGTMRQFQAFLKEAHRRGLRVITELVLNHTSDRHPWFQRARREPPGSRSREFYVWSDTPDRYRDARIIFKDFEAANWTLDPAARAYYWHRFYAHQPDLNYDSPDVRRAMLEVMEFWLGQGVDGLRLDAVPYLYEREGTSCENLPETHEFLRSLRRHIDERYAGRMLLAEANQWPEDAIAYFGGGDECHMAFHFPLMPRLFMAIRTEDRFPIVEILQQTPQIPEACQWALFLRNHDELTLEMVTDEDRDYMYRVYARDPHARINLGIRRRLAPLLGNHRRRIELMDGLLFSIPGTPIVYYGDELGMGDNIYLGDRNSVRTPMQWSADRNAGFSRASPQQLYLPVNVESEYHYETVNVEAQQNNPHSLLWWMKRLVALRKRFRAFGRGTLEFLHPENRKVLAFLRRYGDELILVVANLSRFVQYVELSLPELRGMVPVELFGRTEFPPIGDLPYFLTLGPHSFYWFALEPQRAASGLSSRGGDRPQGGAASDAAETRLPVLTPPAGWESAFQGKARAALEDAVTAYLRTRRWFGGKARRIRSVRVREALRMPYASALSSPGGDVLAHAVGHRPQGGAAYLTFVQVDYTEGDLEVYALPLTFASGERAEQVRSEFPHGILARLRGTGTDADGVLYDALGDPGFCAGLLETIGHRRRLRGEKGDVAAAPTPAFRLAQADGGPEAAPSVLKAEQSNSSVLYGDRFILKLFRRLEPGENPDLEIGRFLTERTAFPHVPPVAGAIEYRADGEEPLTLAILHRFVPNEGDAWGYTLDALGRYYDRVMAAPVPTDQGPLLPADPLVSLASRAIPPEASALIGAYLPHAQLLGQRTAELHAALAADHTDPAFAPEPLTALDQRSLYQSIRALAQQNLALLRKRLPDLPETARPDAERVVAGEAEILKRFRQIVDSKISGMRIRCHGDYHLGQVLYTGKDFVIIDFEGEPARRLGERRLKRSCLRDVAGMLRSFHYAASAALLHHAARGAVPEHPGAQAALEWGARAWYRWVCAAFMKGYLDAAGGAAFMPGRPEDVQVLLDAHLLEKAIYEIGYELQNRPEWIRIPLQGILDLLQSDGGHA